MEIKKLVIASHNQGKVGEIREMLMPYGVEVVSASRQLIEYKEALIFAFMGVLRMRGERNCLRSVTGARKNACGGCVFLP